MRDKIKKNYIIKENGSRVATPEYRKLYYEKNKRLLKEKIKVYLDNPIPSEIREEIYKRDNYECQVCGQKEYIGIHHFNENRKDNNYWNLLTLCPACHRLHHTGFF